MENTSDQPYWEAYDTLLPLLPSSALMHIPQVQAHWHK